MAKSGLVLPTVPLAATEIETDIQKRLAAEHTNAAFLDTMALNDALFVCEYLGAPHRQGLKLLRPPNVRERLDQPSCPKSRTAPTWLKRPAFSASATPGGCFQLKPFAKAYEWGESAP
jgi:hypothetical protein